MTQSPPPPMTMMLTPSAETRRYIAACAWPCAVETYAALKSKDARIAATLARTASSDGAPARELRDDADAPEPRLGRG